MKSIVVYQAYGRQEILEQNLFSIVSLYKRHKELSQVERILVYTDQPRYFLDYLGKLPTLQFESMSPDRLKSWRGEIDFVHRVKIEMLRDAASKFPDHNLFYLDGDTYFLEDPSHLMAIISRDHSIMHEAENVIDQGRDPLSKKIARFLRKHDFQIAGKRAKIPINTMMWNAGVLGFPPVFFKDLDLVLSFTDQSYARYQKHIMEQLAFSYFLAQRSRIHSAREYVHHYWRQKDEYALMIRNFLERTKNLQTALAEFDQIEWPASPQPKPGLLRRTFDKWLN